MQLSNAKRKQIRRLAQAGQSAAAIAKAVGLPIAAIEQELQALRQSTAVPASAIGGPPRDLGQWLFHALTACVAVAPLLIIRRYYNLANLPQTAFIQSASAVLLAGWLFVAALDGKHRLRWSGLHLALGLFIVYTGCSLFWALNRYEHLVVWGHWLACFGFFLLVCQQVNSRRRLHTLLVALYASGCLVALIGVLQQLCGLALFQQVAPPSATFANKNFAVHYVIPTLAIGMGLFLWCRQRRFVAWLAAGNTLMVAYLFYTGTRAGWVALAVQLGCWALWMLWHRRLTRAVWRRGHVVGGLAGVVGLLVLMHLTRSEGIIPRFAWTLKPQWERVVLELGKLRQPPVAPAQEAPVAPAEPPIAAVADSPVATAAEATAAIPDTPVAGDPSMSVAAILAAARPRVSAEQSFAGRLKVWRNSMFMVADHPLVGVGIGNFSVHFPLYDGRNDGQPMFSDKIQLESAHNDYVQLLTETGLLGVLFFLGLAGTLLLTAWRAVRAERETPFLLAGVPIAMIGMAVNAVFSSPLQKSIPPLTAMVLAGVLVAWRGQQTPPRSWRLPAGTAWAACGTMAIVALAVLAFQSRRLTADRHYLIVSAAQKQQIWNLVEQHGAAVLAAMPSRARVRFFLGKTYIQYGEQAERTANAIPERLAFLRREVQRAGGDAERREKLAAQIVALQKQALELEQTVKTHFQRALHELHLAEAGYPNDPNLLFDLAVVYRKLEAFDQAMAYYTRLETIQPAYPKLHNNIADILLAQGQVDQALARFRLEVQAHPEEPLVWLNLSRALRYHTDQPAQAMPILDRVIAMVGDREPTDEEQAPGPGGDAARKKRANLLARAHVERAELWLTLGQGDRCDADLRRALDLDPDVDRAATIRQRLGIPEPPPRPPAGTPLPPLRR